MNFKQVALLGVASVAFTALSAPAHATDVEQLEKQIQELTKQVQMLKKQQEQQAKEVKSVKSAGTSYSGGGSQDVTLALDPAGPKIKTKDGSFEFGVNGRVQVDSVFADDDASVIANDTNLRRARLAVGGKAFHDWKYKLEADFANNATAVTDAYVEFAGIKNTSVTIGQFKEPFSLEELTSSRFVTFLERASVNALAPGRNIGLGVGTHGDNWSVNAGVFGDSTGGSSSTSGQSSVTARVHVAPQLTDDAVLHLGAAASYRKPGNSESLQYRARPDSGIVANRFVDTGTISDVSNTVLVGLESALVWNQFSLQGEYIRSDISRENNMADIDVSGYYGQASLFLTEGDSRNYNKKKGVFDRVKPKSPFDIQRLDQGALGAWEVAFRYSNLDLNDSVLGASLGGEMQSYTVGLNWYPVDNIRFMGNVIKVQDIENGPFDQDEPILYTLRAQVDF